MQILLHTFEISYIYKVRFENENKNQSNENKMSLYQHVVTDLAFSLNCILCSCSVLFRCIFVSYLFLDSDYSFYFCGKKNE